MSNEKGPFLVILAAGMGSRYGGLKQMDAFGGGGEALLDYSVYDALRAGFRQVVFIIRHDIEEDFRSHVLSRMEGFFPYTLAFQEPDSLIPPAILARAKAAGRTKPWGTAHALLCAEKFLDAPFAVINADDFYGLEAYAAMAPFLADLDTHDRDLRGAIVPYSLKKTLSSVGTVTRGVCEIRDGVLTGVEELTAIRADGNGNVYNTAQDGTKRLLTADTPVSMNFWGYPVGIFPHLRRYFEAFLDRAGTEPAAECYIPTATDWMIKEGLLKVSALSADADWFGVTYREDRPAAAAKIAALTERGVYPEILWQRGKQ